MRERELVVVSNHQDWSGRSRPTRSALPGLARRHRIEISEVNIQADPQPSPFGYHAALPCKITPISVRFRASESQFSSRLRPKFRHIQSERPRCEQEPDQAKCMENQNGMCLAHRERQMLGIPLIRNWPLPPGFSDEGTTKGR
jgi:hypothetical protein